MKIIPIVSCTVCILAANEVTYATALEDRPTIFSADARQRDDRGTVRIRVRAVPGVYLASDFALEIHDARAVSRIEATRICAAGTTTCQTDSSAGQASAIVFVVENTERFLGGCSRGSATASSGALAQVNELLLDARGWGVSHLGLVLFGDGAPETRGLIAASEFAVQLSQQEHCGHDGAAQPIRAVNEATRLLRETRGERLVIVFVGGSGTKIDEGLLSGIEAYSLVVRLPPNAAGWFAGELFAAESAGKLFDQSQRLLGYLRAVYDIEFACPVSMFDGQAHRATLLIRGNEVFDSMLIPFATKDQEDDSVIHAMLLGVALMMMTIVVVIALVHRKRAQAHVRLAPLRTEASLDIPRKTLLLEPVKTREELEYHGPLGVAGWLVSLTGKDPFQTYVLNRSGDTVIGTGADCGLVLVDGKISKRHCTIRGQDGKFCIVDDNSLNGVLVDGARIEKQMSLRSGMRVRLGDTELVFKAVYPVQS